MTIVRGPQNLEVTEGDTATLECELSQALADVTWEKVRAQPWCLSVHVRTVVMPGTERTNTQGAIVPGSVLKFTRHF